MFKQSLKILGGIAALYALSGADTVASDRGGAAARGPFTRGSMSPLKRSHPAGSTAYRMRSGGVERRYVMYVPKDRAAGTSLPVVFDFHGSGSDPGEEMQISGLADAAERYGFLLLMPVAAVAMPGGGYTWNVPPDKQLPDDVLFAIDVLEHAAERVAIDRHRVYLTGFSGGARLASQVACAIPERIAAIGAVGGLRFPPNCDARPVPVVAFHGTGDPINPYAGGGAEYWGYGVEAAVSGWIGRNGCAAEPATTRLSGSVTALRYHDCRRGADVVLYRVEGGGHTWPGSAYPFPEERFGKTESGLDATERMLEFFASRSAPTRNVPNATPFAK